MTIQSIGSNYGFASTTGAQSAKSSSDDYSSEIKLLQDEKKEIQKQINDIKTGKQSQEIKDSQMKVLQQQMTEIDAKIQQKQIEQAKDKVTDNTQQNKTTAAQTGNDNDRVEISGKAVLNQMQLTDLYNKSGKLEAMSKTAHSKAAELKSDAKIAADNGNTKVSATLSGESGSLSAAADNEITDATHIASNAVKGGNKAKTENPPTTAAKKQEKGNADGKNALSDDEQAANTTEQDGSAQ
jgi:hypothetical protein